MGKAGLITFLVIFAWAPFAFANDWKYPSREAAAQGGISLALVAVHNQESPSYGFNSHSDLNRFSLSNPIEEHTIFDFEVREVAKGRQLVQSAYTSATWLYVLKFDTNPVAIIRVRQNPDKPSEWFVASFGRDLPPRVIERLSEQPGNSVSLILYPERGTALYSTSDDTLAVLPTTPEKLSFPLNISAETTLASLKKQIQ